MSLRAVRMQTDRSVLYLKWEVPFRKSGHKCPHEQCGQDIKLDSLDTPPRSYLELAEVSLPCRSRPFRRMYLLKVPVDMQILITSHFGGNCAFCDELLLTTRGIGRSRVGQIDVVNPDSDHTMWHARFYVFQENGQWCFTAKPPRETGKQPG